MSACSLDLDLPETPLRGALKGAIDTQGHLAPGDRDVVRIDTRGGRLLTKKGEGEEEGGLKSTTGTEAGGVASG